MRVATSMVATPWFRFTKYDVLNIVLLVPLLLALSPRFEYAYSPTFLACWTAREAIRQLLQTDHDHTSSNRSYDLVSLLATIICIIFTATCGVEHLDRDAFDSEEHNLFDAFWFVMVTFSTVGYGDIFPGNNIARVWVLGMIMLGLVVLPGELSKLGAVYREAQANGTHYSAKRPHVVVCGGSLRSDIIRDLLVEFFAVQTTGKPFVVLLGSVPQSKELYTLLQHPRWRSNAQFLHGSPLVKVRGLIRRPTTGHHVRAMPRGRKGPAERDTWGRRGNGLDTNVCMCRGPWAWAWAWAWAAEGLLGPRIIPQSPTPRIPPSPCRAFPERPEARSDEGCPGGVSASLPQRALAPRR